MTDTFNLDRRALLGGIAALSAPGMAHAAKGPAFPATQAFLDSVVDGKKLANCVVAIAPKGRPVSYLQKGAIALDTDIKADASSIYRVYSMSKPITGAAFMTLVEKGVLRLDQPISDILPEFARPMVMQGGKLDNVRPAASPILMRHLITHTSGLSYGINGNAPLAQAYNAYGLGPGGRQIAAGLVRPTDKFPPARDLETFGRRLATLPLDFDPGTKWQYSVGLDLMGLVIQRASGMPFYDYLRTTLFEPLGMHDTDFVVMGSKLNRFTSNYNGAGGKLTVSDDRKSSTYAIDREVPSGGGGLTSTAADYVKFTQMLANEGMLGKVRVLKPETVRIGRSNLMDARVSTAGTFAGAGNGFGAAVQVLGQANPATGEGQGTFGWDGAAGTTMWVDPVNKVSVVGLVQIQGGTNIHAGLRTAVYKDLRATGLAKAV